MMITSSFYASVVMVAIGTGLMALLSATILVDGLSLPSATSSSSTPYVSECGISVSRGDTTRREWWNDVMTVVSSSVGTTLFVQQMTSVDAAWAAADADDDVMSSSAPATTTSTTATSPASLEMKDFIDPQGLFSLRVPKDFFTIRRTVKGDLPDAKTGTGRRGSSIFTAGNLAKAEVVAVERFPTKALLEENGVDASGDLSTFPSIGEAQAVANLIVLRREKDKTQQQQLRGARIVDDIHLTPDGKQLTFRLKTEIDVQKPELLLEQFGVSQLFRITLAKVTLDSNDGNIMAVFASALEQDFTNGVDGPALEDTVRSFQVTAMQ